MVTTHLQHNTQPRQPVNLPDFSHPLENFRGANNFAPDSRQTVNRRPQTTQSVVRQQPVQFFNKFEDGRLGKPQQQPRQQTPTFRSSPTPRQGKSTSLDTNFGSFPSRSSQQSLPPRQSVSRLPVQQQPSNNEKLASFTQQQSFNQQTKTQQQQPPNNFQSQPQQQFNRFQPQQQQNRFQPQQQQTRFQPQQQNNNFKS